MTASLLRLVQGDAAIGGARPLPVWFITFTDLIGLLLAFFILLFSMSSFDAKTWPSRVGERPTPPGAGGTLTGGPPEVERNVGAAPAAPGREIDYLANLVAQKVAAAPSLSDAVIGQLDGSLVISLPGAALFDAGSTAVAERARFTLAALGELLETLPNRVEVAAHDRTKKPGGADWDLSLARAVSVGAALAQAGYRGELVMRGLGASRSAQVPPSITTARRQAFLDRIDIVVRDAGGGDS